MIPVFWNCPNGHILGQVVGDGDGLAVYNQSQYIPPEACPDSNVEIIGKGRVRCTICGAVRVWSYKNEKASIKLAHRRAKV